MSTLNNGHRKRLKEKLLKYPEAMPDYEILELVLGLALLRSDTKPLAKNLLDRFQTISGVLDAKPEELLSVVGFGPGLVTLWGLLRELMSRYVEGPLRSHQTLCTPESVADLARVRLAGHAKESVWVAFVDTKNRLISWEQIQRGTIDQAPIYPRDILERALILKASGFFLVHNHPGGGLFPSPGDIQVTQHIQRACSLVGLRFIDHLIVADSGAFSLFNERVITTSRVVDMAVSESPQTKNKR